MIAASAPWVVLAHVPIATVGAYGVAAGLLSMAGGRLAGPPGAAVGGALGSLLVWACVALVPS